MIIFAAVFSVVGWLVPRTHLMYFDKTDYISFVESISFDRRIYKPCDVMQAVIKADIKVSSPTVNHYRLMKIEDGGFNVKLSKSTPGFANAKPDPVTFIQRYPLPCDIEPGTYLFRGQIDYKIQGIDRTYDFDSPQFIIVQEDVPLPTDTIPNEDMTPNSIQI